MNSKTQKAWMSVVIWLGLVGATAFTSKATIDVFFQIVSTMFSGMVNGFSDLFSNYGLLFITILGIVLIFLIVSAWLGLVTYSFEVSEMIFAKEEDEEEEEASTQPGSVARYLAFAWGLFFIIFLVLPAVMQV